MAAREFWTSRTGFVLATVGSAVGLGNVWRFPYVCYENGGGAFLIPYFVALLTTGIPLLVLEFGLGHKLRSGAPQAFASISPRMEWLGWAQLFMCLLVVGYYSVVMAWCWVYLVDAWTLGWDGDAAHHFEHTVLGLTSGPLEMGTLRWPVVAGLVATWLVVFASVVKGVKVVSRIVMLTVPVPIFLLAIFVLRGVTLPGAMDGLNFYLEPDFARLADPSVWLAAYGQVFFSSSLAFGVMIAYASYLPEKSDVTNNAFITVLANCGTSFFSGFAVFGALGFLAQQTDSSIADVVQSGPGLVFVTYPTILDQLPFAANLLAVLFFVMLLTLGIDSTFSLVEGIVAGVADEWSLDKGWVVAGTCLAGFALGLVFSTGAGLYWLDIVDHFITFLALPFVGLLECLLVGWVLGPANLRAHLDSVSDFRLGRWWDFCVAILTPLLLGAIFVTYLWARIVEPYEGYPQLALGIGGWGMLAVVFGGGLVLMWASPRGGRAAR